MSNPMFDENCADKFIRADENKPSMTMGGVLSKTIILSIITIISVCHVVNLGLMGILYKAVFLGKVGIFGTFGIMLIVAFLKNQKCIMPLCIAYSIFLGFAIGGIGTMTYSNSSLFSIALMSCTVFITLGITLFLYSVKIIKTDRKILAPITAGMLSFVTIFLIIAVLVVVLYLFAICYFIMAFHGLVLSLFICFIAPFSFIDTIGKIEKCNEMKLAKNCEWYGALAIMAATIWFYVDFIEYIAKLCVKVYKFFKKNLKLTKQN